MLSQCVKRKNSFKLLKASLLDQKGGRRDNGNKHLIGGAKDVNMIHIAGHLGADPEVRFTSTGKKVTTLRVATRTRVKGQDDTIWFRVTVWDNQFEKKMPHFKKGSAIIVVGELHKPEIFNDREGKPQISMEITAVSVDFSPFGKPEQRTGSPAGPGETRAPSPYMSQAPTAAPMGQITDDEVPF
jgi:single-strand DNA-binding protein